MKAKVAIIGTLNMELNLGIFQKIPDWGRQVHASKYEITGAGSALRVAFPLLRLGERSCIFGKVGNDIYGQLIQETIQQSGLGGQGVEIDRNLPTGICISLVGKTKDRILVSYLGALGSFSEEDVMNHYSLIRNTQILLITGYCNLPGLGSRGTKRLLQRCQKDDILTLFDPGWDASGWKEKKKEVLSLLHYIDVFLPNQEEAIVLSGSKKPQEMAKCFLSKGIKRVFIKLGGEGSFGADRQGVFLQKSFKVRVEDPTAAGEAFNAGIIWSLLQNLDLKESQKFANALAALSISKFSKEYPTIEEVKKMAKKAK
ncbi:MAG: carbohydrate kinase family protein [Planctomycetes bacterium]|nr:carbohydrate kinase family protein [Planctomycetota bacterium]